LGAVPAMVGNMQALETIKAIVGRESPATSGTILIELESMSMSTIKRPKISNCPLCGAAAEPFVVTVPVTPEWEVTLAEFKVLHPQGAVIDIRSLGTTPSLDTYCVGWMSVPKQDTARLFNSEFAGQSLLVCDRGGSSRNLTQELHSAGHTNFWSLKGGAAALK
jgi:hypothetical protein